MCWINCWRSAWDSSSVSALTPSSSTIKDSFNFKYSSCSFFSCSSFSRLASSACNIQVTRFTDCSTSTSNSSCFFCFSSCSFLFSSRSASRLFLSSRTASSCCYKDQTPLMYPLSSTRISDLPEGLFVSFCLKATHFLSSNFTSSECSNIIKTNIIFISTNLWNT